MSPDTRRLISRVRLPGSADASSANDVPTFVIVVTLGDSAPSTANEGVRAPRGRRGLYRPISAATSRTTLRNQTSAGSVARMCEQTSVICNVVCLNGGGLSTRPSAGAKRRAKAADNVVTMSVAATAASAAVKCGVTSAMRRVTPSAASSMSISDRPSRGRKPAILSYVTRIWMKAAEAGRIRLASLRCTDFYGPGVPVSHLGESAFGATGITLGIRAVPLWSLPVLGLFVPFMREVADVGFTWDRPYEVDARKFTRHFRFDVTPYEIGAPATALSFRVAQRIAMA
jgi:hypothetical protein